MSVSAVVKEMRARHLLSQAQLAARAGTTQQAVSRIERGVVSPTVETLERLTAACGETLLIDVKPREVPFEDAQLWERQRLSPSERAELAFSWNKLAGELAGAGSAARDDP